MKTATVVLVMALGALSMGLFGCEGKKSDDKAAPSGAATSTAAPAKSAAAPTKTAAPGGGW